MATHNGGKPARRITLTLTGFACLMLLVFSGVALYKNQTIVFFLYKMLPGLEFSFVIDRLSAFFILIISVVSLCVAIYSTEYVEHYHSIPKKNALVSLMALFILSMVLVVASKNMFSFLFFWEIMAISSALLVMFDYEKKETKKAGLFYVIMTLFCTLFLFTAFVMIYNATGTFDIVKIPAGTTGTSLIFLFLFIGFGIKAGIVPFHKWLPYAHPASPSNISALMSGVMIKIAIYGMMRFIIFALSPELSWGLIIFFAGLMSAILGVIYALKEHDIKRLLAYHSIENIGIILIGFGLYIIFQTYGLNDLALISLLGSLFHTLNHAIFKSLLFLTTGSLVNATGTKNIEEMGGLIKTMPYTGFLFFIGAASISALPPLNGFASEFLIFQALFRSSAITDPMLGLFLIIGLSIFALTSALAAACFVKAFGITFLAVPRSEHAKNAHEAAFPMILGSGILAALCIVLGVFSYQIFALFGYSYMLPNLLTISVLLSASYILAFAAMRSLASQKTRTGETWGCGILSQNSRMEYTASGFSEPIMTIFKSIFKTSKINRRNYFDKSRSIFKEGYAEIHLLKFFEEKLYLPVSRLTLSISAKIFNLHRGDVDKHMIYAFAAIVILFVLIGWLV